MVPRAPADASDLQGPLLERDGELSKLAAGLETVTRGASGRLVLVSGDAGTGKTALLKHFCANASDRPRVLWGDCDPLFTPRPLGPLLAVAEDEVLAAPRSGPPRATA
jgi:predicted ATPase